MNKRVSLKDIAQQVGVSIALVSYVLNNQKEGRINKEVAQKIRDTARALNYRTNQIAKSLKTKKTLTIGLIVADISNPFFSGMARIIEDVADTRNYTVIFGSSDENVDKLGKLIDIFLNRQVDGLIIAPPEKAEKQIAALKKQQVPFVLIDRYFPKLQTSYIALDNYDSAYRATEYLVKSGCKRPGLITYNSALFHMDERIRGFENALLDYKIVKKENWVQKVDIRNVRVEIEEAVKHLLGMNKPADAILFASNSIADFGVKYINTLSLKVPADLSVITFDEPLVLDLFYAPLSYVRQPLTEMGASATMVLIDQLDGKKKQVKKNLKGELVLRASTS